MSKILVFTDLDGTLLDHHTYSYEVALPAIQQLTQTGCPLIFNSSKTAAEIQSLHQETGNSHPFITENGSAVCIQTGYFNAHEPGSDGSDGFVTHSFGPSYRELLAQLHDLRRIRDFRFKGFSDLNNAEVAKLTGLDIAGAQLAKQRQASEPLIWEDTEAALDDFRKELAKLNLTLTRGGRFYHVMGPSDKAQAMLWLTERYRSNWPGQHWITVALGDGPNDQAMLETADIAVAIPPASGDVIELKRTDNVIYPETQGPGGWKIAIEKIIQDLNCKGA